MARHWASTVHANVKRKKLDKTYMGLSLCFSAVVPVWLSPQCGCWRIRYKTKFGRRSLRIWYTLLAAISILHFRQLTLPLVSHACTRTHNRACNAPVLCTQNIATPTIIPYPHRRGPTMECRPTPHFGLNFLLKSSVYSNMRRCVAALENARLKWLVYEE